MSPGTRPRIRPFVRAAYTLPLALLVVGCGALTGRQPSWGVGDESDERITVLVENQNFSDARIFARWNGERRRLGMVTGNTTETFTMPGRSGNLRLEVDFVAGGSFVTQPLSVGPGERVRFQIPARR